MAKSDASVKSQIGLEGSWCTRMGADQKADFNERNADRTSGVRENRDRQSFHVKLYSSTAIKA